MRKDNQQTPTPSWIRCKNYLTKFFYFYFIFIFTLFYFTILYWFCHTLTWIHHGSTCVPKHEPPSHLPPHNISLAHHRTPAPSMLYPASDIDWRFNSYMIVYMCSPSWTLLPRPSPSHPSGSSQCTSCKHPVSYIKPGLAICFTYDNIHISNAILPNHPTLTLSHRVQQTVLYICASFAVSHTGLSLPSF